MVGVNLVEAKGLNQYYSLANKFFDYIHAGLPQVCMNYPEYKRINDTYQVALFINDLKPETIARAINNLITNDVLYKQLQENCLKARAFLNWQQEEKKLLDIYASTFEK
jgi:glycosyltransferase involved in cell wall biosynthesis